MEDVNIFVGDELCYRTPSDLTDESDWVTFECYEPLTGSSITLDNDKSDTRLYLCGINVYGPEPEPEPDVFTVENTENIEEL